MGGFTEEFFVTCPQCKRLDVYTVGSHDEMPANCLCDFAFENRCFICEGDFRRGKTEAHWVYNCPRIQSKFGTASMLPLLLCLALFVFDVYTDINLAAMFFSTGEIFWARFTVAFITAPVIGNPTYFGTKIFYRIRYDIPAKYLVVICLPVAGPILCAVVQIWNLITWDKTQQPGDRLQIARRYLIFEELVARYRIIEMFTESAPQLLLQLYIVRSLSTVSSTPADSTLTASSSPMESLPTLEVTRQSLLEALFAAELEQVMCICGSFFSVVLGMLKLYNVNRSLKFIKPIKCRGKVVDVGKLSNRYLMLGQFSILISRLGALSLFASVYVAVFFVSSVSHMLAMFGVHHFLKKELRRRRGIARADSDFANAEAESSKKSEIVFSLLVSMSNLVSFNLDSNDEDSFVFLFYIGYYALFFFQNVTMLYLSYTAQAMAGSAVMFAVSCLLMLGGFGCMFVHCGQRKLGA